MLSLGRLFVEPVFLLRSQQWELGGQVKFYGNTGTFIPFCMVCGFLHQCKPRHLLKNNIGAGLWRNRIRRHVIVQRLFWNCAGAPRMKHIRIQSGFEGEGTAFSGILTRWLKPHSIERKTKKDGSKLLPFHYFYSHYNNCFPIVFNVMKRYTNRKGRIITVVL